MDVFQKIDSIPLAGLKKMQFPTLPASRRPDAPPPAL
jgi:hypothetical protein